MRKDYRRRRRFFSLSLSLSKLTNENIEKNMNQSLITDRKNDHDQHASSFLFVARRKSFFINNAREEEKKLRTFLLCFIVFCVYLKENTIYVCDRCSTQSDVVPFGLSLASFFFIYIFREINETGEFFFPDEKRRRR